MTTHTSIQIATIQSATQGRWAPPAFGTTALLVLLVLLASATSLNAQRWREVDLRCLTSKEEHCLPEPMPRDEPHKAVCATCHNVWTQPTTADAARTCAGSECHARADTLTPFHRGLAVQVRRNCIGCHPAHDVRIPRGGENCTFCHTAGGEPTTAGRATRPPARIVMVGRTPAQDRLFRHTDHSDVTCTSCHTSAERHGSVSMTRARECQSCHHKGERLTVANCANCHIVTRAPAAARASGRVAPRRSLLPGVSRR
jgi:hypothetical protein